MIRDATTNDIAALLALGERMHAESIYAAHNYSITKVDQLMRDLIASKFGIVLVAEQDGIVQGGFVGCVYPHWFGDDLLATDYALFLAPEHRKGTTAARLIKQFIQQAKDKGAVQIMLANSTGVNIDGVANLYQHLGFVKQGYIFDFNESV